MCLTETEAHPLDRDLAMTEPGSETFALCVSDRWSINGNPNGGYLMALMARAMEHCSDKHAGPIITANYIARCLPGPAEIRVEVISRSQYFSRLMARLIQQGEEKIRALGTFSLDFGNGWARYDSGPPEMASFEESFRVPVMKEISLFDHIDLRLDPASTGWLSGHTSQKAEFRGWVGFKRRRGLDIPAILLFADTFPPPVFAKYGLSDWVPTIELSVNIRRIPDTDVLKGIFTSRFASGGLVEEDGELWDLDGNLVAVSRQISKYRGRPDP